MYSKNKGLRMYFGRTCLILLATIFFVSNNTILAAKTYLKSDFNKEATGSKPAGYAIEETGGSVEIVEVPGPEDKSVYLYDPGTNIIRICRTFKPITKGVVVVELSFMQPKVAATAKVVRLLDSQAIRDADSVGTAFHIETRSGGKFAYRKPGKTFTEFASYVSNKWYKFRVVADFDNKIVNIYLDGVLMAKGIPFLNPVTEIGAIDTYTPGSTAVGQYIDNVRVYKGKAKDMSDPGVSPQEEKPADQTKAAVAPQPSPAPANNISIKWESCLAQNPEWYSSKDAILIADNVLFFQRDTGGWFKNTDMVNLSEKDRTILASTKSNLNDSTIDNGATTTQIKYLALVYNATKIERFKESCLKGIDYLLKAQYPNGGWPQYYPQGKLEYHMRITYNDDAMVRVLNLLREIAGPNPVYAFVDQERKQKANQAVAKGIDCILKTQIRVNGKLTAWCAQHDQVTLAPADARDYELKSISGQESVGIIRFLMGIDNPSPEIINSIQAAVAWLDAVKITGIKVVDKPDPSLPGGFDRVVVPDPTASAIWARFYEIETNRPFFVGRDGVKKYSLAEIEQERRIGYRYYTTVPTDLMNKDYPEWQKKWAPNQNVLQK